MIYAHRVCAWNRATKTIHNWLIWERRKWEHRHNFLWRRTMIYTKNSSVYIEVLFQLSLLLFRYRLYMCRSGLAQIWESPASLSQVSSAKGRLEHIQLSSHGGSLSPPGYVYIRQHAECLPPEKLVTATGASVYNGSHYPCGWPAVKLPFFSRQRWYAINKSPHCECYTQSQIFHEKVYSKDS